MENWDDCCEEVTFSLFENEILYVCFCCQRQFSSIQGLQHHKQRQHAIRDFFCEICLQEKNQKVFFSRRCLYNNHKRYHHKK